MKDTNLSEHDAQLKKLTNRFLQQVNEVICYSKRAIEFAPRDIAVALHYMDHAFHCNKLALIESEPLEGLLELNAFSMFYHQFILVNDLFIEDMLETKYMQNDDEALQGLEEQYRSMKMSLKHWL